MVGGGGQVIEFKMENNNAVDVLLVNDKQHWKHLDHMTSRYMPLPILPRRPFFTNARNHILSILRTTSLSQFKSRLGKQI